MILRLNLSFRLPRLPFPRITVVWADIHLDKLFLLPLWTATTQDFGMFYSFPSKLSLISYKMKIPLMDIISTELSKAFRFGHHGLIVIIKGHEELFFEFGSYEKRAVCVALLDQQMEDAQARARSGEAITASKSKNDAVLLEELEPSGYLGESALYAEEPRPPPETEIMPAVMFTSNSSTFLEFKPKEKLHITCLTIGSRGDCQPYIALCKRLQADGHTCRIATHEEYKDWVEGVRGSWLIWNMT